MNETLKKVNDLATWIVVALLFGILIMLVYYPNGQAYLRCEKNAPLLEQYDACVNKSPDYYPSFSCVAVHTKVFNGTNFNWTIK